MSKLTPDNVLGNGLIKGEFQKAEQARLGPTMTFPQNTLKPINTAKFSEYFIKCTSVLNSILKRGEASESGEFQQVVKGQIGFIGKTKYSRTKNVNSKYATQTTAFSILHPAHVALVCKKDKRQMVKDFVDVKSDILLKFHDLKVLASDFVEDYVTLSDAFEIAFKLPSNGVHAYVKSGHMLLNGRTVPKDQVRISITDNTKFFGDYSAGVVRTHTAFYRPKDTGEIAVTIYVDEPVAKSNAFDEDTTVRTTLVRLRIRGNHKHPIILERSVYDVSFSGIDVNGMVGAIIPAYTKLYDDFEVALEDIKEKYLGEFLLSEICDSKNSAI